MNTYTGYTLVSASKDFFKRYADFSGRSTLSAYWYWYLANLLITWAIAIIEKCVFDTPFDSYGVASGLWSLVTLVPSFALWVRRLHDIGKSGWNLLWMLIPGVIMVIFLGVIVYNAVNDMSLGAEDGVGSPSAIVLIGTLTSAVMLLVGAILLFVYSLKDSQYGTNKWGPSEKYPEKSEELPPCDQPNP